MGKKATAKKFRNLAEAGKLPPFFEKSTAKHIMTGAEIVEAGYETEMKLDPKTKYLQSVPVTVPVNHARRLRKAFARNGYAGVEAYGKKVADSMKKEEVSE